LGKKNELVDLIEDQIHLVHSKDKNGWTPLHEASRAGQVETAKYLIEKGAKMNERFLHGQGGTALFLAGQYHGVDSEIYKYLKSLGAVWLEPDQEL
jgi:prolyl 4-hydroxylase